MRALTVFLILTFMVVTISCDPKKDVGKASQTKTIDSVNVMANDVRRTPISVQYSFSADQKLTPWQGNLKASAYWKDDRGENIMIVSELPQYFWEEVKPEMKKFVPDDWEDNMEVAELFAYHYIYNVELKKWKAYWTLNDFQFFCCDVDMKYVPGTLKITDLDSNGRAESVFSYYSDAGTQALDLNYDGKLMLHVDSVKYSIKGRIGKYRNMEDVVTPITYSENFSRLSPRYKEYAEEAWKGTIAIRDSMDNVIQTSWNN